MVDAFVSTGGFAPLAGLKVRNSMLALTVVGAQVARKMASAFTDPIDGRNVFRDVSIAQTRRLKAVLDAFVCIAQSDISLVRWPGPECRDCWSVVPDDLVLRRGADLEAFEADSAVRGRLRWVREDPYFHTFMWLRLDLVPPFSSPHSHWSSGKTPTVTLISLSVFLSPKTVCFSSAKIRSPLSFDQ